MWLLIVFVLYLCVLAGIGVYCTRFNRTLADFVLGGRRLGPWVTAMSAQASDMSAWLLIALPASAFAKGLSAIWIVIGCAVGEVFDWVVIAPRLRKATGDANTLTIPDYLASRYGEGQFKLIRIASVVVILLAYATYIASQFIAAGKTVETTCAHIDTPWGQLDVGYHTGMLVGIGIILLYTAMGGFMAVAWTDFLQGLLMITTVIVLPLVGLVGLGGLGAMWSNIEAINPNLLGFRGPDPTTTAFFVTGVCIANLSWGLGYPGQPHILVRYMALRDPKRMRRAATIGIVWMGLAMSGAVFVGLVGRAMLTDLGDPEHVTPTLACNLMHPGLAGLMIAGAMAAMMSTVDSQLLVASSAVEEDVYIRLLGGRPRDRRAVWIGRVTVLVLGAAALPIAWNRESVFRTVFDAWNLLGAALGPVIVLGLLTKRTNKWGALVGIITGFVMVQFWSYISPLFTFGEHKIFSNGVVPGFVLNFVLAYAVSLLTTPREGGRPARQV